MDLRKEEDLALLLAWPPAAALLSLFFEVGYLGLIVLFFAVPSLYLSARAPRFWKKAALFSALLSVPGTILIDSLMHATEAYIIHSTVFPFRVFGLFPAESFVWAFFSIYFPVMFYEYFLHDHAVKSLWPERMRYLLPLLFTLTIAASALTFALPAQVYIPHIYIILGVGLGVIPVVIDSLAYPSTARRIAEAGVYFFFLTFVHEVTALKLGIWEFQSTGTTFTAWLTVLNVQFPLEELVFYFIILSMAMLAYYDFWDDYQNH